MNCSQSRRLLSAYHDAELPSDQRAALENHLERCLHCPKRLAGIRKLSDAMRELPVPRPPDDLWNRILASLVENRPATRKLTKVVTLRHFSEDGIANNSVGRKLFLGSLATATTVLIAIGIVWWWTQTSRHDPHGHDPLVRYATEFSSDPAGSQQQLTAQYSGRVVSADQATRLVGYRPANVGPPPDGFELDALYLLDMPCCKCIEAVWKRDDDSCLAIFEHIAEPEEWFQDYPSIQIPCSGKACRVTEVDNQLTASWRCGQRTLTVVGLRDTEELTKLVMTLP